MTATRLPIFRATLSYVEGMGTKQQPRHTEPGESDAARQSCRCCSRAMLPAILHAEDVAHVLGLKSASAARRQMRSGRLGRILKIGNRLMIMRAEFLAAAEAAQYDPATSSAPHYARGLRRGSAMSG